MRAWELMHDGTMEPVTVLGRSFWPGCLRIQRADGSTGTVYASELVDSTGQRLTRGRVA